MDGRERSDSTGLAPTRRPLTAGGPAVVALGGGHGLAASLTAARRYASRLTGIVSVADDGGSSGRLRAEFGVGAPGDVRRCLSALSDGDGLLARCLEHRFQDGTLSGHPIGNLLLVGMSLASGDAQASIDEVGRLVGAVGRVFPATEQPVTLIADSDRGTLAGQVTIERASGIHNLRFDPPQPSICPEAIEAVCSADQVLIGPGSLFTSVLATAVVPAVRDALDECRGQRVFIANIANEKGDARGFGLAEHIEALNGHGIPVDLVLVDVSLDGACDLGVPVLAAPLAAADGWSHDPHCLSAALADLLGRAVTNGTAESALERADVHPMDGANR